MARWQRFWLVASLTYMTPVAIAVAANPAYWWWVNGLVVLGPPAVAYWIGWAVAVRKKTRSARK